MIKKIVFLFSITQLMLSSFAITLDELTTLAPLEGRMSHSSMPEARKIKKISQTKIENSLISADSKKSNQTEMKSDLSFADLSLKRLAQDVSAELEIDGQTINGDLSILWAATLERSETMKYTIYKLSNPDEDKPNEGAIKKILKPIANISTLAGASVAGDPFVATGALIGGGLVNAFMKDDKEVNYKFSKVSDADMVLLVRKIDNLQKKLLDLYVDYKTKQEIYKMTNDNYKNREDIFKKSKNKSKEELTIADSYYRNAKAQSQKAFDEYMTSKAILENLVGKDALSKIN